jgi:alpha-glucosidase
MKTLFLLAACVMLATGAQAKDYTVQSPDGSICVTVSAGERLSWSVAMDGGQLLFPSEIALTLTDGSVYGHKAKILKAVRKRVDQVLDAPFFKRSKVHDCYNELTLVAKDFSLVFRVADDGAAYRFVTKKGVTVKGETAEFCFPEDHRSWVPYANENGTIEQQMHNSFENHYADVPLSGWDPSRIAFLPVAVEGKGGVKICITETDLFNYPGMYLSNPDGSKTLRGVFAAVPDEIEQGGHNMLEGIVKSRKPFIYEGVAGEALPWRILAVAREDRQLAQSDIVWRLSRPSEGDYSWVKPGKVAWDWWNDWNVRGVDFPAGVNTATYKYYIDFAAAKGVEYVILDEGWAVNLEADLMQVVPEIDLPELCSYSASKGVKLVLWAGYWAFNRDMEAVCAHYAKMGIAGWKIDFMNRDDQPMVAFYEKAARTAAKYRQIVDFHGAFKPSGLIRAYPNVLNHEGVAGLEQMKWAPVEYDQVTYDVTIPYIRFVAGPADYTQGAMRNGTKQNYHPLWSEPMSQGTRCRQLAEYIVFDAPFTMLCDSPSNYLAEPECTDFIASVPTVWDDTVALDGKIGEYIVMARRSGSKWYVAAMTDWSARDITIELPIPAASGILWRDGVNADRFASDYSREAVSIAGNRITVHLAPGGACILELGE